jgi:hypothetical protein
MVIVTQSKRMWLLGLAVSVAIFAVLYFTVIQPDNNTANQAVKTGLQQSQQAINQAKQQVNSSGGGAASNAANAALNHASKLTSCLQSAGTDASAVQACQVKFQQ